MVFSDDFSKNGIDATKYAVDAPFFEGGKGTIAPQVENGVLEFTGEVTQRWWAGATLRLVEPFPVSAETNLVVSVDRVLEDGQGSASRSALWIMDESQTKYVLYAYNRGEGGWQYNRKLGISGDNPTGGGSNIGGFDAVDPVTGIDYDDLGQHRMKAVINGQDVKLYLDDKFGATVRFPFNKVVLHLGSYARNGPPDASQVDTAHTVWDNLLVQTVGSATFGISSLTMGTGQTASNLVVRIPPGANADEDIVMRIVSRRPAVAVPAGATAGTLALTFAKGGPNTKTFDLQALTLGGTQLSLTNDVGLSAGNVLDVTVVKGPTVLLEDSFSGSTLDATKWRVSNQPFEGGEGTFDVTQTGGTLQISGSVGNQYWPGASVQSVGDFTASKDLPLSVEVDRLSIDRTSLLGENSTAARTGVFLTSYDNNNNRIEPFVLFAQDLGETGWQVNVAPGNPTGSGTALSAFANLAEDTGNHRLKLVADGSTVEVFLDGVSGGRFPFAAGAFIKVELAAYARTFDDAVKGVFDNVKIENVLPCITASPADLATIQGDAGSAITLTIPRLLSATGDARVTVTSRDPSVAIPEGAVGGSRVLTFATGQTNVQSFKLTAVGAGVTTFDLSNDKGACVFGSIKVTVTPPPVTLLSDEFASGSIDTSKWSQDNTPLAEGGAATAESAVSVKDGTVEMAVTGETASWPGFALFTTKSYTASATSPAVLEIDRTKMEYQLVTGTGAKQRTGVWVRNAAGNYVFFSEFGSWDGTAGGWQYQRNIGQAGDTPVTGNGVYISEFNAAKYTDQKNHHMKVVANGSTVKLYLDGVLGAEVPFPFAEGITFGFGTYVQAATDIVRGYFDNAVVLGYPPGPPQLGALGVSKQGANFIITWTGAGTLQSTDSLSPAKWADVTPAPTGNSFTVSPGAKSQTYYRLRQ